MTEGTAQEEEAPPTNKIPQGIKPLFFSGPSQQIFECVVDTHLTSDNPYKLISKEKILDDFKNRAAVCDFHPVKKQVQVHATNCIAIHKMQIPVPTLFLIDADLY